MSYQTTYRDAPDSPCCHSLKQSEAQFYDLTAHEHDEECVDLGLCLVSRHRWLVQLFEASMLALDEAGLEDAMEWLETSGCSQRDLLHDRDAFRELASLLRLRKYEMRRLRRTLELREESSPTPRLQAKAREHQRAAAPARAAWAGPPGAKRPEEHEAQEAAVASLPWQPDVLQEAKLGGLLEALARQQAGLGAEPEEAAPAQPRRPGDAAATPDTSPACQQWRDAEDLEPRPVESDAARPRPPGLEGRPDELTIADQQQQRPEEDLQRAPGRADDDARWAQAAQTRACQASRDGAAADGRASRASPPAPSDEEQVGAGDSRPGGPSGRVLLRAVRASAAGEDQAAPLPEWHGGHFLAARGSPMDHAALKERIRALEEGNRLKRAGQAQRPPPSQDASQVQHEARPGPGGPAGRSDSAGQLRAAPRPEEEGGRRADSPGQLQEACGAEKEALFQHLPPFLRMVHLEEPQHEEPSDQPSDPPSPTSASNHEEVEREEGREAQAVAPPIFGAGQIRDLCPSRSQGMDTQEYDAMKERIRRLEDASRERREKQAADEKSSSISSSTPPPSVHRSGQPQGIDMDDCNSTNEPSCKGALSSKGHSQGIGLDEYNSMKERIRQLEESSREKTALLALQQKDAAQPHAAVEPAMRRTEAARPPHPPEMTQVEPHEWPECAERAGTEPRPPTATAEHAGPPRCAAQAGPQAGPPQSALAGPVAPPSPLQVVDLTELACPAQSHEPEASALLASSPRSPSAAEPQLPAPAWAATPAAHCGGKPMPIAAMDDEPAGLSQLVDLTESERVAPPPGEPLDLAEPSPEPFAEPSPEPLPGFLWAPPEQPERLADQALQAPEIEHAGPRACVDLTQQAPRLARQPAEQPSASEALKPTQPQETAHERVTGVADLGPQSSAVDLTWHAHPAQQPAGREPALEGVEATQPEEAEHERAMGVADLGLQSSVVDLTLHERPVQQPAEREPALEEVEVTQPEEQSPPTPPTSLAPRAEAGEDSIADLQFPSWLRSEPTELPVEPACPSQSATQEEPSPRADGTDPLPLPAWLRAGPPALALAAAACEEVAQAEQSGAAGDELQLPAWLRAGPADEPQRPAEEGAEDTQPAAPAAQQPRPATPAAQQPRPATPAEQSRDEEGELQLPAWLRAGPVEPAQQPQPAPPAEQSRGEEEELRLPAWLRAGPVEPAQQPQPAPPAEQSRGEEEDELQLPAWLRAGPAEPARQPQPPPLAERNPGDESELQLPAWLRAGI